MKKHILPVLLLIMICCFACVLASCSEDPPSPPETGLSVSGRVTSDGEPLPGVSVLVNGEARLVSDSDGVFSLSGLNGGEVIAFVKEGFSFSPDSHTVKATVNDLDIRASEVADEGPDEPAEPDESDEPDEPDLPDVPDVPAEPDPPEEPDPVLLTAPFAFFSAYTAEGNAAVGFSADVRTETFTLSVLDAQGGILCSAQAAREDGVFRFPDAEAMFDVYVDEDALDVTVNVSALVKMFDGSFTVTVTSSAQNAESATSLPYVCEFATGVPTVSGASLADGVLSWQASFLPDGCTFAVTANGVKVLETTECSADLSLSEFFIPEGAELKIVALADGKPVAVSEGISFVRSV